MRIHAAAEGTRVAVGIHGSTSFRGGADSEGVRVLGYEDPMEALRDALDMLVVAQAAVLAQQAERGELIKWLQNEHTLLNRSVESLGIALNSARIERDELRARVGE